jgi:hypothetical protein
MIDRRSRQFGVLNILQPCGHPTACYGDSFTFLYLNDVRTSQETRPWGSTGCYRDNLTFLYVYDIHTSQGTHLWAFTACYRDSLTFLYVYDIRTSQKTHLWASTACYRDSFTFAYVDDDLLHRRHTYEPPRPVPGIALFLNMGMIINSELQNVLMWLRMETNKIWYQFSLYEHID